MGVEQLALHFVVLGDQDNMWGKGAQVFCLIIHSLIHFKNDPSNKDLSIGVESMNDDDDDDDDNNNNKQDDAFEPPSSVDVTQKQRVGIVRSIWDELPTMYLHVPDYLKVFVNKRKVTFTHWQRRLAELSHFPFWVHTCQELSPDQVNGSRAQPDIVNEHAINVFIGFDVIRAWDTHRRGQGNRSGKATACIRWHSRKTGRLIKVDPDGRAELNLNSGSNDYCQGLTIIVDDAYGELPLLPTKTDFAFAERADGEIHKENLIQWISGITKMYWQRYAKRYHSKLVLGTSIRQLHNKATKFIVNTGQLGDPVSDEPFRDCEFTTYEGVEWSFRRNSGIYLKPSTKESILIKPGKDTQLRLRKPGKAPAAKVKKSTATENQLKRENETLEIELDSLRETLTRTKEMAKNEMKQLKVDNSQLRRQVKENKPSKRKHEHTSEIEAENAALRRKVRKLETDGRKGSVGALKQENAELRQQFEDSKEKLSEENATLRRKLKRLAKGNDAAAIQAKLDKEKETNARTNAELLQVYRRNHVLEMQLRELQSQRDHRTSGSASAKQEISSTHDRPAIKAEPQSQEDDDDDEIEVLCVKKARF